MALCIDKMLIRVYAFEADAACIPDSRLRKVKELGAGSFATGALSNCFSREIF